MSWEPSSTTEKKRGMGPAGAGTVLFMALTVLVLLCYVVIFINPQVMFNPFKPVSFELPATAQVGAAASTPTVLPTFTPPPTYPPTWTPTLTPTPTGTFTPRPTFTPAPPTSTPMPLPAFSLNWDPVYAEQKLYDAADGWWSGVAGEVADRNGRPVTDVTIKIWDDEGHVWETVPGDAQDYAETYGTAYGSQGTYAWWEQFLFTSCRQSVKFHVQVIRDGKPASNVINLETTGECDKNLILIHFVKNW